MLIHTRPSKAILLVLLAVGLFLSANVLGAPSASASCMMPPLKSADTFVGTVVSVEQQGKIATVRTQDGEMVTVIGGPGAGSVVSSVDRHYVTGTTYEFHPLNRQDPYRDNACTATHPLGGHQAASPTPNGAAEVSPIFSRTDNASNAPPQTDSMSRSLILGGVIGLATLGIAAGLVAWRRRTPAM